MADDTAHITRIDQRESVLRPSTARNTLEYRWVCCCGNTGPWMPSRTRVRNGADMHRANAKVQGY